MRAAACVRQSYLGSQSFHSGTVYVFNEKVRVGWGGWWG